MTIKEAKFWWAASKHWKNPTVYQERQAAQATRLLLHSKTYVMPVYSKKNPVMTLEQATRARLSEIADIAESGVTEMTGKIRRSAVREGDVIGRFGGMKSSFPELSRISAGPKSIAKTIRKGRGKAFERLVAVVAGAMEKHGYTPSRIKRKSRPTVTPHSGMKSCRHCQQLHTTSEHRFHGQGSFHRTHLWGFNPNPSKKRATVIYGRVLEIQAQKTQKHICDRECKKCNHCYTHAFRAGAVMLGLPNGDILITTRRP